MFQFNQDKIIKKTPVLKNNNHPSEWAKLAYAVFKSGFYRPNCSFLNAAWRNSEMNSEEPNLLPTNLTKFSKDDITDLTEMDEFIKVFKENQKDGAMIGFSITLDGKNKINIVFPPVSLYDKMPEDKRMHMPMINCFCDKNEANKAVNFILGLYNFIDQ